jgi:hypothetical protein
VGGVVINCFESRGSAFAIPETATVVVFKSSPNQYIIEEVQPAEPTFFYILNAWFLIRQNGPGRFYLFKDLGYFYIGFILPPASGSGHLLGIYPNMGGW